MSNIALKEVDRVEITVLVDNVSDLLLEDSDTIKRLRVLPPNAPLAEPGLSCLITVTEGVESSTVLMDTGISGTCLKHNGEMLASSLGVMTGAVRQRLETVETIVLSHGHFDHFSGLTAYLQEMGKEMTVVVHPGAFVDRRLKVGPDAYVEMPAMVQAEMEAAGAIFDIRSHASTLASDRILVTGEVARTTGFEKGSQGLEACLDGAWVNDPFEDDQGIAMKIKGKGLVIIGGCAHSGIINIVEHVRRITGTGAVHAVIGGFHLGGQSKAVIESTVQAMKAIGPDLIVPMHCTGWQAIQRFASEMPDQFAFNSVGTTYLLGD